MKLPIKPAERVAHHKPNATLYLHANESRSYKKRDYTPQRSNPIIADTPTNTRDLTSTYSDTFVRNITANETPRTHSTRSGNLNSSPNHTPKASPRFLNPSPKIDKTCNIAYYNITGLPSGMTDQQLRRHLRKQGVEPANVKLHTDTITHEDKGRAFMVLNTTTTRTAEIKAKLQSRGISMEPETTNKRVHHSHARK